VIVAFGVGVKFSAVYSVGSDITGDAVGVSFSSELSIFTKHKIVSIFDCFEYLVGFILSV
jgi:hypothetical protein